MMWPLIGTLLLALQGAPDERGPSEFVPSERVRLEAPAPGPYVAPPGVDLRIEVPINADPLLSQSSLSGRLTSPGQVLRHALPCKPGEHLLLECDAWGYARGTESQGVLRVVDGAGQTAAQVGLKGRTLHQALLSFEVGNAGPYAIEIQATEGLFRYVLIRHDAYKRNAADLVRDMGALNQAHGYLDGASTPAEYRLRAVPGSRILIHVEPTRDRGQASHRRWLTRRPALVAGVTQMNTDKTLDNPIRMGERPYPKFALALPGQDPSLASHSRTVLVPVDGWVRFAVTQQGVWEAGMFDLTVERDRSWRRVEVRLANREDKPHQAMRVAFVLEPFMTLAGACTTSEAGLGSVEIPDGPYSVVVSNPVTGVWKQLRLRSDQDQLYLVW